MVPAALSDGLSVVGMWRSAVIVRRPQRQDPAQNITQ